MARKITREKDPRPSIRAKSKKTKAPQTKLSARPTLKEVAQAAGVSLATASNVISKKYSLMSSATRSRVEDTIREMNYRVNVTGRSLRSAQNTGLAFIALDDDVSFLRDPFTAEMISGFANSLTDTGYNPIVQRIDPQRIEQHALFSTDAVAGLCMSLQGSTQERRQTIRKFTKLQLPIVLIATPAFDIPDVCAVKQDDFGGAMMLAHHVLDCGAKKVLMVRQKVDWPGIDERERGLAAIFASKETGRRLDVLAIDHMNMVAEVDQKLDGYLDGKGVPDAIMAANDQIAAAAIRVLNRRRIKVPDNVLVTGFNGFEVFDLLPYRITTVRSDAYGLGFNAAQELVHRLRTGTFRESEITLSVSMRRGTTA